MGKKTKPQTQTSVSTPANSHVYNNHILPQAIAASNAGTLSQQADLNPFLQNQANFLGANQGALQQDLANRAFGTGDLSNDPRYAALSANVADQVNAQFNRGGGSNYRAQALARGMSQGGANILANDRNAALNQMAMQSQGMGNMLQQRAQNQADSRFNNLQRLNMLAQGLGGGTTTNSQMMHRDPVSGAIGGAMQGYSMFGPLGAIGGGILGAL